MSNRLIKANNKLLISQTNLISKPKSQNSFNSTQAQTQPKGLLTLPPAVLQMVPWIPLMLEMTTGQKVPQMSGTIGEIQTSIQQIQASQAQILQRLTSLEGNATQQLTSLKEQVVNAHNNFRLLATETKRTLELMNNPHSQSIPES